MALIEENDRHQVYLNRLATNLLRTQVYPSMDAAYKAARRILLETEEITSITVMRKIQAEVRKTSGAILAEGMAGLTDGLVDLAQYEAGYSARLFGAYTEAALAVPAVDRVERYVKNAVMTLESGQRVTSGVWADYVNRATDSMVGQYNSLVARGYQNGQTVGQISRQLRDSTNGLLQQQANTLARTGLSHFATQAREAMAAENADIIKYRVFTATFDNRTTISCRSLSGKAWEIGDDSYVRIPVHFGCRSAWLYTETKEQAFTGKRSAVGGKGPAPDPDRKLRRRGRKDDDIFDPGQINASTSQDAWLRKQPEWFQDDSLGATRAKLFREGGIEISSFTDMTGRPLTLDQLRERDAAAFLRAGI